MRKDPEFSDVTLVCDGDAQIEAHIVIWAGSSTLFSRLLKQKQHPHPLLYMRGSVMVSYFQMSALVKAFLIINFNIFTNN